MIETRNDSMLNFLAHAIQICFNKDFCDPWNELSTYWLELLLSSSKRVKLIMQFQAVLMPSRQW